MSDDNVEIEVAICSAQFVGQCFRCGQPTTGEYDSDEDTSVMMVCVGCGAKSQFSLNRNHGEHILAFDVCGGDNG